MLPSTRIPSLLVCLLHQVASLPAIASPVFPEGAERPTQDQVTKYLADRVFKVDLASGESWRLQYKSNGYFFLNTSTGFSASGDWRAEPSKLCGKLRGRQDTCNEVRILGEHLYYFHEDRIVVKYVPQ